MMWSAEAAARFVLSHMADENGLVCGTYMKDPGGPAFLADWANMTNGLLALFEATRNLDWLEKAKILADGMLRLFVDDRGFSMTPKGGEQLLMEPRDTYDGAMPSGNACAVLALQRFHWLTGEERWREALEKALAALLPSATGSPPSHIHLLTAILGESIPHRQVIIVAPPNSKDAEDAYQSILRLFEPFSTVLWYDGTREMDAEMPLLTEYKSDTAFTAYVCEGFRCKAPVKTLKELYEELSITPD
jgi:uncharacterized protein YyaL (SSP411 family)